MALSTTKNDQQTRQIIHDDNDTVRKDFHRKLVERQYRNRQPDKGHIERKRKNSRQHEQGELPKKGNAI
jgi:hypothetical protein